MPSKAATDRERWQAQKLAAGRLDLVATMGEEVAGISREWHGAPEYRLPGT